MKEYRFVIQWLALYPSSEGRIIEEGEIPVHIVSEDSCDARSQAGRIADNMSFAFPNETKFFYRIRV